jgi:L-fucose isomerase-like protein
MDRRDFLRTGIGALLAGQTALHGCRTTPNAPSKLSSSDASAPWSQSLVRETRIHLKPVMTDMVHTDLWEGPCRFDKLTPSEERAAVERRFKEWAAGIKAASLGLDPRDVTILEPALLTFSEDCVLKRDQLNQLRGDRAQTDAFLIAPNGASIATFDIGREFGKPVILQGLNCRTVDISAYSCSHGVEVFIPNTKEELHTLARLLRARKIFARTRVLFPTDRGLPAVASLTGINEPDKLRARFGIEIVRISYRELGDEMARVRASAAETDAARQRARQLVEGADKTYLEERYVARSMEFYGAIRNLMRRHRCNAFTIECFEFCASRLPEQWQITPCVIHTLFKDQEIASACEADLGALLSMRLLMSVAKKSSHLGNMFLRESGLLVINHSAPGIKMNGFDEPGLPYQLGRFVHSGWGTKAVVDFMNNAQKRVTVARMNPTATKMLLLRGTLVGSSGWDADTLGCSVEARIRPAESGDATEFVRRQKDFGNHLIWTYGDYVDEMVQLCDMLGLQAEVVS